MVLAAQHGLGHAGTLLKFTMLMQRLHMWCAGRQVVGGQRAAAVPAQHARGLQGTTLGS